MAILAGTTKNSISVFKSPEGRQLILDQYDRMLAQFDFKYAERLLETTYGATYVMDSGSPESPPLLLFHGSSSNSAAWFADMDKLHRDFHVIAVDLIGDAGHSAQTRLDMKSNDYAKWIKEIFDNLGIQKASIMGNSLGAWMCLKFASVFPEKVEKMVLLAASGIAPIRLSFVLQLVLYSLRGGKGSEAIMRMVYGNDEIPQEVMDYMDIISRNYSPYTGEIPVLTDAEMMQLSMPVLYIGGQEDKLTNVPKCARRLNLLLARPTIHVLPNTGHVVFDVLDRVVPFLQQQT